MSAFPTIPLSNAATGSTSTPTALFAPSSPSTPSAPGGGGGAFKVTQKEKDRYLAAFQSCKPVGNVVQGDAARDLFMKSTLPLTTLSKIWDLVDPKGTGQLDKAQFFTAMFIITHMKQGTLTTIPVQIPPQLTALLVDSQPDLTSTATSTANTSSANATSAPSAIPASSAASADVSSAFPSIGTSSAAPATSSAAASANTSTFAALSDFTPGHAMSRSSTIADHSKLNQSFVSARSDFSVSPSTKWAISPAEKAIYDQYFDQIDTGKTGNLTGEQAYEFLLKSKLSQAQLAKIWDLSDVDKSGQLNKEEFAVAMALIKLSTAGQALPNELPYEFTPPSKRSSVTHSKGPSAISAAPLTATPTGTALATAAASGAALGATAAAVTPTALPKKNPGEINLLVDSIDDLTSWPASSAATGTKAVGTSGLTSGEVKLADVGTSASSLTRDFPAGITAQSTGAVSFAGTNNFTSLSDLSALREANGVQEKEKELETKKRELAALKASFGEAEPNLDEIRKKRTEIETELTKVRDERNNYNIKLSQTKALYDTEAQIIQETTAALNSERQTLQLAVVEVQQAENILTTVRTEKESLLAQLSKTQADVEELKAQTLSFNEQAVPIKEQIDQHRTEILKHVQAREINEKALATAQESYNNYKMDIGTETRHLDSERTRASQLEQQISVQSAITEKEKINLENLRKEKIELQENFTKLEAQAAELEKEKKESDAAVIAITEEISAIKSKNETLLQDIESKKAQLAYNKTKAEGLSKTLETVKSKSQEHEATSSGLVTALAAVGGAAAGAGISALAITSSSNDKEIETPVVESKEAIKPVEVTETPVANGAASPTKTVSEAASPVKPVETPVEEASDKTDAAAPALEEPSVETTEKEASPVKEDSPVKETVAPVTVTATSPEPTKVDTPSSTKSTNPFLVTKGKEEINDSSVNIAMESGGIPPSVSEFEDIFSKANTSQSKANTNANSIADFDKEFEKAFESSPLAKPEEKKVPIFGSASRGVSTTSVNAGETGTAAAAAAVGAAVGAGAVGTAAFSQSFSTKFDTNFDSAQGFNSMNSSGINTAQGTNNKVVDDAFSVFAQQNNSTTQIATPSTEPAATTVPSVVPVAPTPAENNHIPSALINETESPLVASSRSNNKPATEVQTERTFPPKSNNSSFHGSGEQLGSSNALSNGRSSVGSASRKETKKGSKDKDKDHKGGSKIKNLFGISSDKKKEKKEKIRRENSMKSSRNNSPTLPDSPAHSQQQQSAVGGIAAGALEDPGAISAIFAGDPNSAEVKQLLSLGFTKEQALDALERYGFDVTKATNYLLDQQ